MLQIAHFLRRQRQRRCLFTCEPWMGSGRRCDATATADAAAVALAFANLRHLRSPTLCMSRITSLEVKISPKFVSGLFRGCRTIEDKLWLAVIWLLTCDVGASASPADGGWLQKWQTTVPCRTYAIPFRPVTSHLVDVVRNILLSSTDGMCCHFLLTPFPAFSAYLNRLLVIVSEILHCFYSLVQLIYGFFKAFFSFNFFNNREVWRSILLGQVLSVLLCATAVISQLLYTDYGVSAPTGKNLQDPLPYSE